MSPISIGRRQTLHGKADAGADVYEHVYEHVLCFAMRLLPKLNDVCSA